MNTNPKILLAALCFLLSSSYAMAQYRNKQNIYLNFNQEVNDCPYPNIKTKWVKPGGIQFNLCGKAVLQFSERAAADTLALDQLSSYEFVLAKEVDAIASQWRKRNKTAMEAYYGTTPPPFNKNAIFNTFLVEVLEDQDCIVVYPVVWKHEGTIALRN